MKIHKLKNFTRGWLIGDFEPTILATKDFEFMVRHYKKGDKAAGERLVRAAVAKLIAPEYAGFQLASQGISATIPALNHQFETIKQGWPEAANLVVENLPPELQKEAKKQHAALLKEIKQAKEQHAARGYPVKVGEKTRLKYNPATGRLE